MFRWPTPPPIDSIPHPPTPSQEAGNASVTPLELRVFMSGGDHLLSNERKLGDVTFNAQQLQLNDAIVNIRLRYRLEIRVYVTNVKQIAVRRRRPVHNSRRGDSCMRP
ncbi:hypothetical protein EVAR_37344_1 [Eumeta japonica]|uniref:Uncharacterized protein n=1 Tax=Eumeta variegata TaxID=151549 RepID=A0A4C1X1M4_EUMVA|nr:hypothetical protein EVAR_37344_1 [Eumeta japonica]